MSPRLYAEWKRDSLVAALARAGVEAEVGALIDAHGEGRRRATFHARFIRMAASSVGFMRARAHEIVDIDACPLFAPEMAGAIDAARALAGELRGLGKPLDIQATATLGGLDFDLRGSGPLEAVDAAQTRARRRAARSRAGLQSRRDRRRTSRAERRLRRRCASSAARRLSAGDDRGRAQRWPSGAAAAFAGARRVADLFCGAGAFALRLAATHEVFAADSDAAAIAALERASGEATRPTGDRGRHARSVPASAAARGTRAFDAVLFDPPRAGADAQARALAREPRRRSSSRSPATSTVSRATRAC